MTKLYFRRPGVVLTTPDDCLAHVAIQNPVGSGVLAVIERVTVSGTSGVILGYMTGPLMGNPAFPDPAWLPVDPNLCGSGKLEVRTDTRTDWPFQPDNNQPNYAPYGYVEVGQLDNLLISGPTVVQGPYVLAEGRGLLVRNIISAQGLRASFAGYEEEVTPA